MSAPAANPFGHVDLRVSSMPEAMPFYEALLPALGFTRTYHGPEWKAWATEQPPPATAYFAIVENVGHAPNSNRIAFWTAEPGEVDRLAALVRSSGGLEISGPRAMPYGPGYYAVYFCDPCGNPFEVYHRPPA